MTWTQCSFCGKWFDTLDIIEKCLQCKAIDGELPETYPGGHNLKYKLK